MTVKELQEQMIEYLNKWHAKRGSIANERSNFIHMVEEVGELATQYVNIEKRQDKFDPKEIENALGDIMFQVVEIAHLRNLDLEEILTKIMKTEEKRLEDPKE